MLHRSSTHHLCQQRLVYLRVGHFHCFACRISSGTSGAKRVVPPPPLVPGVLKFIDERLALVYPIIQAFKLTITLDPLNVTGSWVGSDICNYKGFICEHPPDNVSATTVAGIDFNGFGLSAPSLVGFIDKLPDLGIFHANTNGFAGVLPLELANLQYLYELDISNNLFTGTFPFGVLRATGLTFLDIRYNLFLGSVPGQVFRQNLDAFFLNNNLFTSRLQENLGATPAEYLTFANNRLIGPIPRSIGNLKSTLTEVLFLNNMLSGCVPYEIGFLNQTTVFDASANFLTGELPTSLACMGSVEILSFAKNRLYGAVPEAVCSYLRRRNTLYKLQLSNNYFTSVGSECMKLVNTKVLDLKGNCIPGLPNQKSFIECLVPPRPIICPIRNRIPCKRPSLSDGNRNSAEMHVPRRGTREVRRRKRSSITYAALSRDRLL